MITQTTGGFVLLTAPHFKETIGMKYEPSGSEPATATDNAIISGSLYHHLLFSQHRQNSNSMDTISTLPNELLLLIIDW